MKKALVLVIAVATLVFAACGEPEAAPDAPEQSEITIVAEGGQQTAQIAPGQGQPDTQPADPQPDTVDAHTDSTGHFEDDVVATLPAALEQLTADMTVTYDAEGNEVYADGARTVTRYEWDIDGQHAHRMMMDTAAYRYIAEYAPNGRLFRVTAVPMDTIDPTVCADAYLVYAELYYYGAEYYGYLYNVEQDGVIMQTCYDPTGRQLFTYGITVNVYGEAVQNTLYNGSGELVCKADGVEDFDGDERTYEDGSGNPISSAQYDELVLSVCGDWLNDYYGNVYGA